MFYCRENELAKLNKRYQNKQFECVVIYGRRRVGKTALINEFCKDKKTIYFSALDSTASENLKTLSRAIYGVMYSDMTAAPEFSSYDDAFLEIGRLAKDRRLIFVIDEYPYLAKSDPSISSRMQHLIDHQWADGRLFLILCGSSMSFMEHQVLGYESPLYGRRTAQFKIEPLTYRETALFHPNLSVEDNALIYGITGGVPHYINKLGVKNDLDEALLENLFDPSGYLFEEPANLLKQELREPGVYNSIITAIAEGASKLNEISTKTQIPTGPCSKYLKVLTELGIIRKDTPVTEKSGKRTIYSIKDNFFRFWYRFVPRNITMIGSGRFEQVYEAVVKSQFSDYMGLIFEAMCRQYLICYAENLPLTLKEIGQWWGTDVKAHRQVQIDIVGLAVEKDEYLIGSCKYKKEPVGVDELNLLKEYAEVFGRGRKYHFHIFSKGGFTSGLKEQEKHGEVTLLTLEDIYNVDSEKPGSGDRN